MLKGYYDGGGANGVSRPVVVLAGYFAEDAQWPQFEAAWSDALGDAPSMHAVHAYHRTGNYKGCNVHESRALLGRCVSVLAALDPAIFTAVSCVVPCEEYERVRTELAPLLQDKPIQAFCVDHTVGLMFQTIGADASEPTKHLKQIVFDRNEPFLHWMNRVYTAPPKRKVWWTSFVDNISVGDSSTVRGLQAADVLAWVVHRQYSQGDCPEWHAALTVKTESSRHAVYTYERIRGEFRSNG
jgi:hypothetical protein